MAALRLTLRVALAATVPRRTKLVFLPVIEIVSLAALWFLLTSLSVPMPPGS